MYFQFYQIMKTLKIETTLALLPLVVPVLLDIGPRLSVQIRNSPKGVTPSDRTVDVSFECSNRKHREALKWMNKLAELTICLSIYKDGH